MRRSVALIPVLFCVLLLGPAGAQAQREWELYDNFDSGVVNEALWEVDDGGAAFSVENGRLRIELFPGNPGVPATIRFRKNPEEIKSVRARVTVAQCTGDTRIRIGGYTGLDSGNNPILNALIIDCGQNRIYGKAQAEKVAGDVYEGDLYVLYKSILKYPVEIPGKTFGLTVTFQPGAILYAVDDVGKSLFMPVPKLLASDRPFKGIGVKSESGDGTCVVYVDDVYVSSY